MSGSRRPGPSAGAASTPSPSIASANMEPQNTFESGSFTPEEKEAIQKSLSMNLGPEFISFRPSAGSEVAYLEGNRAIELANFTFGFDGWASKIQSTVVDFLDVTKDGKYNCGVCATVRVELKGGSYHEDVGYGTGDNQKTKAAALEKARKEAITDGIKRALRFFGNSLGNCVYNKNYARSVKKIPYPQKRPYQPESLLREDELSNKRPASGSFKTTSSVLMPKEKKEPEEQDHVHSRLKTTNGHSIGVKEEDFGEDFEALLNGSQDFDDEYTFMSHPEELHSPVLTPKIDPQLPVPKGSEDKHNPKVIMVLTPLDPSQPITPPQQPSVNPK